VNDKKTSRVFWESGRCALREEGSGGNVSFTDVCPVVMKGGMIYEKQNL